jgi:hypothetical protein
MGCKIPFHIPQYRIDERDKSDLAKGPHHLDPLVNGGKRRNMGVEKKLEHS